MIKIKDLSLYSDGVRILDRVSLSIAAGETVALTGPSGSGKSTLAHLLLGIFGHRCVEDRRTSRVGWQVSGSIEVCGIAVLTASAKELGALRRHGAGLVVQGLGEALNPQLTVRQHLMEASFPAGLGCSLEELCRCVSIPIALLHQRPASLSGGEAQRVLLAMALAQDPACLILDEPTSALDGAAREGIVNLISTSKRVRAQLLITHDQSLVQAVADREVCLYNGQITDRSTIINSAPPADLTARGRFTAAQINSASLITASGSEGLHVSSLKHSFERRVVLDDVSMFVPAGRCVILMGRSGAGKTTFTRLVAGLDKVQRGDISWVFRSTGDTRLSTAKQDNRPTCMLVPQHGHRALARNFTVHDVFGEALLFSAPKQSRSKPRDEIEIEQLLDAVGLPTSRSFMSRETTKLSGGEAQRVALVRALLTRPRILVVDEPTAALDAKSATRVVRLLKQTIRQHGTAILVCTHDQAFADEIADQVWTLEDGRVNMVMDLVASGEVGFTP